MGFLILFESGQCTDGNDQAVTPDLSLVPARNDRLQGTVILNCLNRSVYKNGLYMKKGEDQV